MKTRKVRIISLTTLVGMLSLMDLKVAVTNTVGRIVDPAAVTYQASKKDMESVVSLGIPAVYAFETGDFNHLAPTYDAEKNEVRLDGDTYNFYHDAYFDIDGNGTKETHLIKFINSTGRKIIKFSKDGKIWAWGIMKNPSDRNDNLNNYTIIDSKGNSFDSKYDRSENFDLPEYLNSAR